MEKFIEFAPIIIILIAFFVQYKIFVSPQQLSEEKAALLEFISHNYVSKEVYRDNHSNLEKQIETLIKDIADVRMLLLSLIKNNNINN